MLNKFILVPIITYCSLVSKLHAENLPISSQEQPAFVAKIAQIYTTAKDTQLRLSKNESIPFEMSKQPTETEISIFVNPNITFQKFWGLGGAITDASSEVFSKLSPVKQDEFLKAYYDINEGIGYSLARTTIHSSDFASGSYTYKGYPFRATNH
jgi:glucosylceramidase